MRYKMILDKIVEQKISRLKFKKRNLSLRKIMEQTNHTFISRRSFKDAISNHNDIAIIGEIKKASPSKGIIKELFEPIQLAKQYNCSDIQALSVLTEQDFFLGKREYIEQARNNCTLPVLRKDFIIDQWQIYESYLIDADAILLIAAILDDDQLKEYLEIANSLRLDVLVEVHDERELERVLLLNARIIGINNRNLKDFSVSLETTMRLARNIPKDKVIVSESGICTSSDVQHMRECGVHALLIGETIMRSSNIADSVSMLRGTL